MSTVPHRFVTCTPVAFHANESFYARDTGLICKELQKHGYECRVVMPLPAHEDDLPTKDLLRVPRQELSNPAWWRSLNIDAVVLYSWADPRYTGIARAIRQAGLKLILHFDSSGELHEHLQRSGSKWFNKAKDVLINRMRASHMRLAHTITTSSPCIDALRKDSYYGPAIADKCSEFPTPVESCFRYDGRPKESRIICVGSWQLPVKRPGVMMSCIKKLLSRHPGAEVDICGPATPELEHWRSSLPRLVAARVHLHGYCSHEQLCELYQRASIALCTSESEGSHSASAEALCCGCSIVCPPRPLLSVVQWYASESSGSVSFEDTPDALSSTLYDELENWQLGMRNAATIAATWQPRFQVSRLPDFLQS